MNGFSLESFDDFLSLAQQQVEPQRLLLVLAQRELPIGHTVVQARQFEAGEGGHLAPLAGVDKLPHEMTCFDDFVVESKNVVSDWDAVFVAALPGHNLQLPTPDATDEAIEKMLHGIRNGVIGNFLVFDRQGLPLELSIG